jgi:hypothetical protein
MAIAIVSHRVEDFDTWKKDYDADLPRRTAAGLTEMAVGQRSGDPGMVYMIWNTKDTLALEKMISDPDLQRVMQQAGVISEPDLIIIE